MGRLIIGIAAALVVVWTMVHSSKRPVPATPQRAVSESAAHAAEAPRVALAASPPIPSVPPVGAAPPAPASLPRSHTDFPVTPELRAVYATLEKDYGPMLYSMIDGDLIRRAAVATCGITEPGAVHIVIESTVNPDGKTTTASTVTMRRSSYAGELAARVEECVRESVLPEEVPFERRGPNGRLMSNKSTYRDDIISFPVEEDEFYQFFQGSIDAFQMTATRKRYFPPKLASSP